MAETAVLGAARQCQRCVDEAAGLHSSARCVCGYPNVPCEWCGLGTQPPATGEYVALPFDPNECGNCGRCGHCDPPQDDHEACRRCGGPNVIWSCQSPLWNFVMRGNDINGESRYSDLVCMPCFILCAAEAGLPERGWRLTLVPEPEGLIYETPSGRVWDPERFLWVEPATSLPPDSTGGQSDA